MWSAAQQPAVKHHAKAQQKSQEADFVDAVHHAQIQPRFLVLFEEVKRIDVEKELVVMIPYLVP